MAYLQPKSTFLLDHDRIWMRAERKTSTGLRRVFVTWLPDYTVCEHTEDENGNILHSFTRELPVDTSYNDSDFYVSIYSLKR